eukprot:s917_g12.t2
MHSDENRSITLEHVVKRSSLLYPCQSADAISTTTQKASAVVSGRSSTRIEHCMVTSGLCAEPFELLENCDCDPPHQLPPVWTRWTWLGMAKLDFSQLGRNYQHLALEVAQLARVACEGAPTTTHLEVAVRGDFAGQVWHLPLPCAAPPTPKLQWEQPFEVDAAMAWTCVWFVLQGLLLWKARPVLGLLRSTGAAFAALFLMLDSRSCETRAMPALSKQAMASSVGLHGVAASLAVAEGLGSLWPRSACTGPATRRGGWRHGAEVLSHLAALSALVVPYGGSPWQLGLLVGLLPTASTALFYGSQLAFKRWIFPLELGLGLEGLVEWRGCVAQLLNLISPVACFSEDQGDQLDASAVLSCFHRIVEDLRSGQLLEVLDADLASAQVVLTFLAQQTGEPGEPGSASKCLEGILRHPRWREEFEGLNLQQTISYECHYFLSRAGVQLPEQKHQGGTWEEDHRESARNSLQCTLRDSMQHLVAHGARILVLGDRGSGKSSLINAAFGQKVAETGVGLSVTQDITLYRASDRCPVHIYDTKGFETLDAQLEQLHQLVQERRSAAGRYPLDDPRRIAEQLHAVWWVIDVIGGGRFQPEQMLNVYKLLQHDGIPVVLVLNKCDAEEDFVQGVEHSIREHCQWASGIVQVASDPRVGPPRFRCHLCLSDEILINVRQRSYICGCSEGVTLPFKAHYGVDVLVQQTVQWLPDVVASSFQRAQNVWLEGLDFSAHATIGSFCAASGLLGAIPLPGSRFFVVPSQVMMILALAAIYKVVLSKKAALHLCLSIATSPATAVPAYIAGEALKLVPVLGLAAMAVDASMALASTAALGVVAMKLLREVRSKAILGQVQPKDLAKIMDHSDLRRMYQDLFEKLRRPSTGVAVLCHLLPFFVFKEPVALLLALLSCSWLLRVPNLLANEQAKAPPSRDHELGETGLMAEENPEELCQVTIKGVTYDLSSFLEVQ